MTTFNRITTGIESAPGGVRIFIRYWSSEHQEVKVERSRRVWPSPFEAERYATLLAQELRERL